ncbi:MAG: hypothetical protein HQM01_07170 [Magnetococcales bacterium]|nr:hypothetical protein [Magnetococcales bacterium]
MKFIASIFSSILVIFIFSGCAAKLQPSEVTVASEHIKEKNYTLGHPMTISVGDAMVRFQDYWATTTEKEVVTIDRDITVKGGPIEFSVLKGKRYPVVGKIFEEGVEYTLVDCRRSLLMVKSDGTIRNRVAGLTPGLVSVDNVVTVIWTMEISDPDARIIRDREIQVDSKKGYENFELLYTGVSASGINLTYREFSPEGVARVAFFQNLVYPTNAKTVTFKKYKIEVLSATAENISFKVLEDGR